MTHLNALRQLADNLQFGLLADSAQQHFEQFDDPAALALLAMAQGQLGLFAPANASAEAAHARRDELDTDARVDLAGAWCLLRRLDDAAAELEAMPEPELANHALAQARLAWCRMQQGRLKEALALYQRSITLEPSRLPVRSALVHLLLHEGDLPAAQQALSDAFEQLAARRGALNAEVGEAFQAQFDALQLELWVATGELAEAEQWLEGQRAGMLEAEWCGQVVRFALALAGAGQHAVAEEALQNALKHYPDQLTLIVQYAQLAEQQGRTGQTVQLLRRAIALADKQNKPAVDLWVKLCDACLHGMDKMAANAADKARELADALVPGDTLGQGEIAHLRRLALNAQAQVKSQAQAFVESEQLFREVLEQAPFFVPAMQGLGQQLMQQGRIDEAVELFEQVQQIDPVQGYAALINARRFPEDEASLLQIEKAARRPSLEGPVKSGLMLQLASAWEKRKGYDKAFELADEANRAARKLLPYDPAAHRNQCARTRHAFCKALYQHRLSCGYRGEDESLPVFVVGMPRSGTTLVEQILAGHSEIFGAGELGVIPSRIQGLNRWERHTGSGRRYPDCVDDLNAATTQGIAEGVIRELRELAETDKPGARFVVDKLPHNFENIGLIKYLFPKAKIISVRRDPRDIAISNFFTNYQAKFGGMGFAYDLTWIGEQLADHNLLMHHWNEVFPGEILELNYEDVVEDTEGAARKMLDYIGVAWESQVLGFDTLDRPVKTASVWQVRQPIYKTSKAKWRRYENHLQPLIKGTNARIIWDPIEMVTLPTPGMLTDGVALYRDEKFDEAEYEFKKLLHHLPEHAAASFMVGLIYVRKGHLPDGIELMERAVEKCPWKTEWRQDLVQACELAGDTERAARHRRSEEQEKASAEEEAENNYMLKSLTVSQI